MTREEAIRILDNLKPTNTKSSFDAYVVGEAITMAIKALEQKSKKDEVILTKEEYGELVSSEFDNGYAKGYREALEQEPILDKIRAEVPKLGLGIIGQNLVLELIDKYRKEN